MPEKRQHFGASRKLSGYSRELSEYSRELSGYSRELSDIAEKLVGTAENLVDIAEISVDTAESSMDIAKNSVSTAGSPKPLLCNLLTLSALSQTSPAGALTSRGIHEEKEECLLVLNLLFLQPSPLFLTVEIRCSN